MYLKAVTLIVNINNTIDGIWLSEFQRSNVANQSAFLLAEVIVAQKTFALSIKKIPAPGKSFSLDPAAAAAAVKLNAIVGVDFTVRDAGTAWPAFLTFDCATEPKSSFLKQFSSRTVSTDRPEICAVA